MHLHLIVWSRTNVKNEKCLLWLRQIDSRPKPSGNLHISGNVFNFEIYAKHMDLVLFYKVNELTNKQNCDEKKPNF